MQEGTSGAYYYVVTYDNGTGYREWACTPQGSQVEAWAASGLSSDNPQMSPDIEIIFQGDEYFKRNPQTLSDLLRKTYEIVEQGYTSPLGRKPEPLPVMSSEEFYNNDRQCNCGSGEPWASCSQGTQYCG